MTEEEKMAEQAGKNVVEQFERCANQAKNLADSLEKLLEYLKSDRPEKEKAKESDETKAANELFEKLWAMYPKKFGKSSVKLAAKKRILKVGEKRMVDAINNYKLSIAGKDKEYIMYGSTFFNGRYQDYLDMNAQDIAGSAQKPKESKMEW